MLTTALYLLYTYLLSSIPFGVVITTLWGGDIDVRAAGSQNIGATNVARVYGWNLAGPVLLLDMSKGFFPTLFASLLWPDAGLTFPAIVALVAFMGHCFPVYLEFRGGKGVATGAGAMLAIAPIPTLAAMTLWGTVLMVTGRSSAASLIATLGLLGVALWLTPTVLWVVIPLSMGIAFTHMTNIRRLLQGEEKAVIRPVRWSRGGGQTQFSSAQLLAEGPAGEGRAPSLWREPVHDPLKPIRTPTPPAPMPMMREGAVDESLT